MKLKYWQIVWEVISYLVSGILLLFYLKAPQFKSLAWLLIERCNLSMAGRGRFDAANMFDDRLKILTFSSCQNVR